MSGQMSGNTNDLICIIAWMRHSSKGLGSVGMADGDENGREVFLDRRVLTVSSFSSVRGGSYYFE